LITREDIVFHFKKKPRPLSFKEISGLLGIRRAEERVLKRVLREMLHTGELIMTRKGLYAPSGELNLIRGYFEAHEGYGFVIPDAPGTPDLFIPPPATMGAMDYDRVIARAEPPGGKGRVIRILDRFIQGKNITGTLEKTRTGCFVKPSSRRMQFDIHIPPEECRGLVNGQKVAVELKDYPSPQRHATGRIVRALKQAEKPIEEIDAVIDEFSLPRKFPREVMEEAKTARAKKDTARRKDLTPLPTITIDGERARDFDDAVSIKLTEIGYRLWVHIADVSAYVPWESAIDLEARDRGTSFYFPDRVIPMLPKELSEDLCSLLPDQERLAFTVEMDFDRYGKRYGEKFYPSTIKSDERMTYTDVARILDETHPDLMQRYDYLLKDFELMKELSALLRERRLKRGSLDFDLPEPEILLDLQGRPENIIRSERNLAHVLIEEFMIAANECVAEFLSEHQVPAIYRIHEEPEPDKIEEILRIGKSLLKTRTSNKDSQAIHEVLEAARDTPKEELLSQIILRSLKQARYSTKDAGHFGLASEHYTHFTSPIRRYPDLVVHRVLKEALRTKRAVLDADKEAQLKELLPELAFTSSRMERVSDDSERAVLKAMKAWFMKDRVGEEFHGKIIGVASYGLRVRFEEFYIEGLVHVSAVTDDFYIFDEENFMLRGRHTGRKFRIGDAITVRVDRVDIDEKEIYLGIVD
jgi:ribonuclease R